VAPSSSRAITQAPVTCGSSTIHPSCILHQKVRETHRTPVQLTRRRYPLTTTLIRAVRMITMPIHQDSFLDYSKHALRPGSSARKSDSRPTPRTWPALVQLGEQRLGLRTFPDLLEPVGNVGAVDVAPWVMSRGHGAPFPSRGVSWGPTGRREPSVGGRSLNRQPVGGPRRMDIYGKDVYGDYPKRSSDPNRRVAR
jgi:hypothetical protein